MVLQWNLMGWTISSSAVPGSIITAQKETVKHEGITWQSWRTIQRGLKSFHEQSKNYLEKLQSCNTGMMLKKKSKLILCVYVKPGVAYSHK